MTTKQELMNQINAIVSEKEGYQTEEPGLKRFNKAQLAKRLAHYEATIILTRQYRAIQSNYTTDEWLELALYDDANPTFVEAVTLGRRAWDMWNNPPIR